MATGVTFFRPSERQHTDCDKTPPRKKKKTVGGCLAIRLVAEMAPQWDLLGNDQRQKGGCDVLQRLQGGTGSADDGQAPAGTRPGYSR